MKIRILNTQYTITKTAIAKHAVGFVVGVGAGYIVKTIIANNIEPEGFVDKTTTSLATVVIAAMAKQATRQYTDAFIDECIAAWQRGKDLGMDIGANIANEMNL